MAQRKRTWLLGAAAAGATIALGTLAASAAGAGAAQQSAAGSSSTSAAKAKLLHLSDFPKGWKSTSATSTSKSSGTAATSQVDQIASCEGVSASQLGANPPTAQASFSRSAAVQYVFESVVVFSSTKSASEAYELFASPKAPDCIGPLLAKAIASGTTSHGITASTITTTALSFPKEDSATTALELGIPVTSTGQTVQVKADFIVIRDGSSLALLAPVSITTGFPSSLAHSLGKKAAARLR